MTPDAWEDCMGQTQVSASLVQGDGFWPCMVNIDGSDLSGSFTGDDCRTLASWLLECAEACDAANRALFSDRPTVPEAPWD